MKQLVLTLVLVVVFCAVGTFAASEKGTMKDSRDGKTYKTVQIGGQIWMAENLNYKTEESFCYEDKDANCAKYGRLYTWNAAKIACPAGWHLPSVEDFKTLFKTVGGHDVAGKELKPTRGWDVDDSVDDSLGFSALPAGGRYVDGSFIDDGVFAIFWSSTENNSDNAYYMRLYYDSDKAVLYNYSKYDAFSVRCLKD